MMKVTNAQQDKQWMVEDDLRTVLRAKEIMKDKSRMAAVKKLAAEKMADLQSTLSQDSGK